MQIDRATEREREISSGLLSLDRQLSWPGQAAVRGKRQKRKGHAFRRKVFDYGHLFSSVCRPIRSCCLCLLYVGVQVERAAFRLPPAFSSPSPLHSFLWGCHGFWFLGSRIMFMSERTIKIAYISAAQRGHNVVCLKRVWVRARQGGVARQSRLRSLICVQSRV